MLRWEERPRLADTRMWLTQHLFCFARPVRVSGLRVQVFGREFIGSCLLVFITEITARAFIIADSNKRRTLSRADIAKAVSKSDQFDFLIDILPREEPFPGSAAAAAATANAPKDSLFNKRKIAVLGSRSVGTSLPPHPLILPSLFSLSPPFEL